MKFPIFTLLTLLALIASALPATAAAESDWYASLGVAWNFSENMKLGDTGGSLEFDFGVPVGSLAAGRRFRDVWRIEAEASFRENDLEVLYFPDRDEALTPGENNTVRSTSAQLNVLRDFQVGFGLRPYLGAGLGPAQVELKFTDRSTGEKLLDDSELALAWQLIAGFSFPLGGSWEMGADYRFWHVPSLELTDENGDSLELKHSVHSGTLHLRYLFGGRTSPDIVTPRNDPGFFIAANLGMGFAVDAEINDNPENFDAFKVGPVSTLALGYDFGNRWRLDLELARRRSDVEIIDFGTPNGQFRADGRAITNSVMANARYRFRSGAAVRPTIGLGIGMASADYDVALGDVPYLDDDATGIAFQGILGLDIALTERLTFSADYRSWIGLDFGMQRPDGRPLKTNLWVHSMSLGVQYAFGRGGR